MKIIVHTPEKIVCEVGTLNPKDGMRLRGILLQSSLYSEKVVTLFFTASGYNVRLFLNDWPLFSGCLISILENSLSFASDF